MALRALTRSSLERAAAIALRERAIDAVLHLSRRSADLFVAAAHRANLDARTCQHMAISADAAASLIVREWRFDRALAR